MLQMVERGVCRSEILLASQNSMGGKPYTPGAPTSLANPDVQVLRVGKFNHPKYGEFEITVATLAEMKKNFDNKIRGVDIAFDYFHKSDEEASGWPTELYLTEEGLELWAKVDWTPEAQKKLQEREIRYFSPDFAFVWKDPETGVTYNNVLFGGGLTNRPFVKDMAAIVAAEEREQMKLEELEAQLKKLSESVDGRDSKMEQLEAAHKALSEEHEKLKKKLAEYEEKAPPKPADEDGDEDEKDMPALKAELEEAKKKLAEMGEAKKMSEKEAQFTVMLSEGKACAAQKDAFMKGDMVEFVKNSQPVNLAGRGSSSGGAAGDREDRVIKLAEEKVKADPKLRLIEALTIANKEIQ